MQITNAKPKGFARVEGMVSDMLSTPLVSSIGTVFASFAATEKKHCGKCKKERSLDLALV